MGREVGGGFRMGNTGTPMADSCQCMAKPIQYCKVNKEIKLKKKTIKIINVHSVLQIAKSIKAKFLKYYVRNCWTVSNTFSASDSISYSIFLVQTAHWFYYIILTGVLILNHPCILRLHTAFYRLFFEKIQFYSICLYNNT